MTRPLAPPPWAAALLLGPEAAAGPLEGMLQPRGQLPRPSGAGSPWASSEYVAIFPALWPAPSSLPPRLKCLHLGHSIITDTVC